MAQKNSYLILLCSALLFFSCITKVETQKEEPQKAKLESRFNPIKELLPLAQPFIISGSVEKIVAFLKAFPQETSYTISEHIIREKESSLSNDDKAELIFGLAQAFQGHPDMQKKLLDLLFDLDKTIEAQLVASAENEYNSIIPSIIAWAHERTDQHKELKDIERKSLVNAIDNAELEAFTTLIKSGVPLDKTTATELLWHTILQNKNPQFIPLLAEHNADLSSTSKGHTLATKAVELNSKNHVAALIETLKKQGVSQEKIQQYLNRFVDIEVGTPLQIALENHYVNLELYLREQGAGEQ